MDEQSIIDQLKSNPELLQSIAQDTDLKSQLEPLANEAVIASRDKVFKEKENWKNKATTLETAQVAVEQPKAEQEPTKASATTSDTALLARLASLETELALTKENEKKGVVDNQLTAALGSLSFKEGGLNVAKQLISASDFEVQDDGSVRHRQNMMTPADYVSQEWSKSQAASLIIDNSSNRGGGSVGGRKVSSALTKKFSDATPAEKNEFAKENGTEAYLTWKARG